MIGKLPLAILAMALATFAISSGPAAQEAADPQAVIERLFEAPEIDPAWFTQDFLTQVPAEQVAALVAGMEEEHGAFQSVSGEGRQFAVKLERADVPTQLVLNAEGRIAGLFFATPIVAGSVTELAERIATLPGRTSLLVLSGGKTLADHNADEPLAVGSAAKLAILKALVEAVAEGRLAWDQVVQLDEKGARCRPASCRTGLRERRSA